MVPVIADSSFVFPDTGFYKALTEGKVLPPDCPAVEKYGLEKIASTYEQLFQQIGVTFSPLGAQLSGWGGLTQGIQRQIC